MSLLLIMQMWSSVTAGSPHVPVECEVASRSLLWTDAPGHTYNINAHVLRG